MAKYGKEKTKRKKRPHWDNRFHLEKLIKVVDYEKLSNTLVQLETTVLQSKVMVQPSNRPITAVRRTNTHYLLGFELVTHRRSLADEGNVHVQLLGENQEKTFLL